jgi:hypothetical protein
VFDPESTGRPSPPTARVVTIRSFLRAVPRSGLGSRKWLAAGAEQADLPGLVTSLTDAGYPVRDAGDKTYRLGPPLITLGHKAQVSMRVSPAAREELRREVQPLLAGLPHYAVPRSARRCSTWAREWTEALTIVCGSARTRAVSR